MNDGERESGQAGQEAKRDVVGRAGNPGGSTDRRYDALIRYMRSVYGRVPKVRQKAKESHDRPGPGGEPRDR